jgi:membrane-bound lytic murein transglycosylase D
MQKLLKRYKRLIYLVFFAFFFANFSFGQQSNRNSKSSDSLNSEAFINTVQQSLQLFYTDYVNDTKYDSIIGALNYEPGEVPSFTDDQICERLQKMNEMTPFHLDCNAATISTIRFFARERRSFIRIAMGRSALYFDMYKEKMAEYGIPIELRFLSVIESGLRPQVKSKAGALGLWQFMYKTGLYFGLEENSYIDERMDPEKSTDAACRYLKQLFGIYGDWNLALAAYNAGPGNVNKAIRKSGNKTTYWEVRPYLPFETQGYVPNFIAAAYMITYHAEHNIIPIEAKIHNAQLDTMCLTEGVHMSTISKLIDWEEEDIQVLNPVYKTSFIPKSKPARCITGPLEKISLLVSVQDSLYSLEKSIYSPVKQVPQIVTPVAQISDSSDTSKVDQHPVLSDSIPKMENLQYHKVKPGDNLKNIALKFNVTIEQIMEWNALRTGNIYVGQRLKIYSDQIAKSNQAQTPKPPAKKYYIVRSGDTFTRVAQKHNLTQAQLQKLNPGVRVNQITIGQRLRVR